MHTYTTNEYRRRPVRTQEVQVAHVFLGTNSAEELLAKILKRHPVACAISNDKSLVQALTS